MQYISTRGKDRVSSTKEAILKGIASDGGLFLPESFPRITLDKEESYHSVAKKVLFAIFGDMGEDELQSCIEKAYDDKFDAEQMVDIVSMDRHHIMELYHGPTCAFKDFALSILPHFMELAAKEVQEEIAVLTATSGDTGKAALEGFKNVDRTKVIVFYPTEGVSEIQRLQMITQEGNNTYAVGIRGNFDEAQSALKTVFNHRELVMRLQEKNILLSSANSINIGRLVPQIVYYFYTYSQLVSRGEIQEGEEVNIAVPTGNFGDILAGYLAGVMGLPLHRCICASNRNNVLTDFFQKGVYDKNRPFYQTNSPSMDILISSNLERLLYLKSGGDAKAVANWMRQLQEKGRYEISKDLQQALSDFYGYFVDDESTLEIIAKYFEEKHYLCDTHTAVCLGALEQYEQETKDVHHTIVASTASPYKFPQSVGCALHLEGDDISLLEKISEKSHVEIPASLRGIAQRKITQTLVIDKEDIAATIEKILGE